jgi:site-specific DNA-methyltransferase (adenine-specific)|nr:MAG TPA: adenine-specific methyltransferase [Bacteriophage sp.]
MLEINKIYNEDCLEGMKKIDDKSIDFIFTDLPFSTTQNSWDVLIPFEPLWEQYERIIKDNGCIALWAQSPFDKRLACSNEKLYRYEWIIEKTKATGHLNAKKMPMKAHENILIFYKKLPTYNPQKTTGHTPIHSYTKYVETQNNTEIYGRMNKELSGGGETDRYPRSVITFASDKQKSCLHPTQKPLALCEYMIKTYTNPEDLVLDSCAGSCTTAVAALNTNRNYICFEKDKDIFEVGNKRVAEYKGEINDRK